MDSTTTFGSTRRIEREQTFVRTILSLSTICIRNVSLNNVEIIVVEIPFELTNYD